MDKDKALRDHLIALLRGGQAFETLDEAVKEFSKDERAIIPPGAVHSAWQILEHMRLALEDIVEFSDNQTGDYKEKSWPDDYWPERPLGDWAQTVKGIKSELARMEKLVKDSKRDLYEKFPWGEGQTLLREAMLAAEHQAYHIGELVELKRWLIA
jgi:hypothetical protein